MEMKLNFFVFDSHLKTFVLNNSQKANFNYNKTLEFCMLLKIIMWSKGEMAIDKLA